MTRDTVVPWLVRRVFLVAPLGLVLVGAAAPVHDARGEVNRSPDGAFGDPGGFPPGFDPTLDYMSVDEDPTGGAIFLDTSGGDAADVASSFGFDVHWLYGGVCVADPGEATHMFDWMFLVSAINGMDPYAGAEPDFFIEGPEGSQSNGVVLPSFFGRAQFLRQSALTSIRANLAHKSASGAGVRIAVLDSGVDAEHLYFGGRVLAGADFVEDGDGRSDPAGHGTAVAGLALAAAPAASILTVRVLDQGLKGTAGRIAAGVRWAVDHDADVVNMSLGGRGFSSAVRAEIEEGVRRGVIFVAAAGNSVAQRGIDFPASEPFVIAVVARPGLDGDVWAPSTRVSAPFPGGLWFRGSGTSFASALVSGGAALAVGKRPESNVFDVVNRLRRPLRGPAHLDLVPLAK